MGILMWEVFTTHTPIIDKSIPVLKVIIVNDK